MTTRFSSGVSVAQAKKDAKRLSKSNDIPLHKALDIVANKHEGEPWNKSINKLSDGGSFYFTLHGCIEGGPTQIQFSRDEPLGIIDGMSGSGKSMLALSIAESYLAAGGEVYYLPGVKDVSLKESPFDLAHNYSLHLNNRYRSFSFIGGRSMGVLTRETYPKNALFIIDETFYFGSDCKSFAGSIVETIYKHDAYVLLMSKQIEDVEQIERLLIYLAFIMFGRRDYPYARDSISFLNQFAEVHPPAKKFLEQKGLGVKRSDNKSLFFYATHNKAELVEVPLPDGCTKPRIEMRNRKGEPVDFDLAFGDGKTDDNASAEQGVFIK